MIQPERIQVLSLAGGISRQAAHLRLDGQVADATNIDFDIAEGAKKRPGTRMGWTLSGPEPATASELALHTINRDASEQYLAVYGRDATSGGLVLRVFETDGTEAAVTISSDAEAYLNLNDAEASQMKLVTAADVTLVINTTVQAQTDFTPNFTVTETFDDVDEMTRHRGLHDSYYAIGTPNSRWFRYDVDSKNVSKIQFRTTGDFEWTNTSGNWNDPAGAAGAFEGPFRLGVMVKRQDLSVTGVNWTQSTLQVSSGAAFNDYEFKAGDRVRLVAGTGVPGIGTTVKETFAVVTSRVSGTVLTLGEYAYLENDSSRTVGSDMSAVADASDWEIDGIYHYYEGSVNADSYESVDDVMSAWTANWRSNTDAASLPDSGISKSTYRVEDIGLNWTEASATTGYVTFVSPFRGSEADDIVCFLATAGDSSTGPQNLGDQIISNTASLFYSPESYITNDPGLAENTITAGNGTLAAEDNDFIPVDIDDPDTRWVEVSAPGSADASLNGGTLPVALTRTQLDPVAFSVDLIGWNERSSGNNTTNQSPELFRSSTREGLITGYNAANEQITSEAHGLTTGDVIQIVGSNCTPTVDGERTVTVVDADTFTVGVNITTAPGSPSGTWRQGGTRIRDAEFFQDRLFFVGGEYVAASQAGDLYNFYADDATVAGDADPIGKRVGGASVADLFSIVPFRQTLLLFSATGQQFELSSDGPFTPTSTRSDPTTNVRTFSTEPAVMGSFVYFPSPDGDSSALHEYLYDEAVLNSVTGIVSTHYQGGLPSAVSTIDADAATRRVVLLERDSNEIYVYRPFWNGSAKVQSAWSRWRFGNTYSIWDIGFLGDRLWLLVESGGAWNLEWLPTRPAGAESNFPYEVHGDRQIAITGTASGTDTVYDVSQFFVAADDSNIDRLVKNNTFTGEEGHIITGGASNGWTYVGTDITVDEAAFLAGQVVLCTYYDASIILSRPFRTDGRGQKILGDQLLQEEITVSIRDSGLAQVRINNAGNFPDYEAAFLGDDFFEVTTGTIRVPVRQDADRVTITVGSVNVTPMTVDGVEHDVSAEVGVRGRTT